MIWKDHFETHSRNYSQNMSRVGQLQMPVSHNTLNLQHHKINVFTSHKPVQAQLGIENQAATDILVYGQEFDPSTSTLTLAPGEPAVYVVRSKMGNQPQSDVQL